MENNVIALRETTIVNNPFEVFENEEFGRIRTIVKDGEPWFVAKDVASALGYLNQRDAIKKTLPPRRETRLGGLS